MTVAVDDLNWTPDFDTVFRDHYPRLVRALTVVSGSREAAADAVQEAFVKAHLKWRRIGQYDDPVGWIRRVAINKLRDEHRRTGRKERAMERLRSEPATTVDEPMIDELGILLAALPRQQRAAIALFYVDGLPIAAIADTLEISEGAVKFHLHKGRERLRSAIRQGETS
jgi:RNA polymerase sigma factor (sigma-70 family)